MYAVKILLCFLNNADFCRLLKKNIDESEKNGRIDMESKSNDKAFVRRISHWITQRNH